MHELRLNRRRFVGLTIAGLVGTRLAGQAWCEEVPPVKPRVEDGLAWFDVRDWGVEGRGWSQTERYFDRLPAKAKGKVRDAVWQLSRHSAGMAARFETDATVIWARYTLLSNSLAMPHMPATGVSGVDLYAQDGTGRWRWLAVGRPEKAPSVKVRLIDGIEPGRRAYMFYLPLYNGVESLEIGLPPQAAMKPPAPRGSRPIVFYGTSITHGGCASRPGMAYPAILGRRLDRPTINLGFSGNGTMDVEVAALKAAFQRLQAAGVEGLVYVEGEHLLGDDGEATVDSSHPTDLGMMRMADALEPVLRPLAAKQ